MSARVILAGMDGLKAALLAAGRDVEGAVDGIVREVALTLQAEAKLKIQQGPKTGRKYRRGNVVHQASAAGQSPASDTGALIGSIYMESAGKGAAIVGTRLDYAAAMEFGSRKMAARPFMRPAVDIVERDAKAIIEAEIAAVTK